MANVTITQLPVAGPIVGTELVPIVQDGQTRQTTTAAIAASPSQLQTFLTLNQELTLPNSRRLSVQTGLGLTDNGALSTLSLSLNGASGALETALTGIVAKTGSTTVVARTLTASGLGLSITDGNGVSGNPTFALTGQVAGLANLTGPGMVSVGGGSVNARVLQGTASEISVANGDGSSNPTIGLALNPVIPGTAGLGIPIGTTAERGVGADGKIRYNSDLSVYEGYSAGNWIEFLTPGSSVTSFSAGTTGLTPSVASTGPVVLSGALNVANGGTGQTTYTDGQLLIGNTATGGLSKATLTQGSGITITNGNGSITIAATSGGGGTVTSVGMTVPTFLSVSPSTITTSGTFAVTLSGTALPVANGGTGQTTYADGELLIGNSTGGALSKTTLTQGTGITITNGAGSITVSNASPMTYPGAGIPNSTGSAWGTSYSVTGSGTVVALATSPSFTTPSLGVATATSINKVALTAPATGSTLTIADGKTLTASNTLTFTGTDGTSFAYPGSSGTVVTLDATQTLTNKRITARVSSTASISSPLAWNSDNFDQYAATAQAGALTINADSGTPTDGQRAIFRLKDNGTPRALTWTTGSANSFQAIGVTLPTTTVANKTTYVGVIYNASASRWDAVAVTTEA